METIRKFIPAGFKSQDEFQKVGNLLHLLAQRVPSPYITTISKLIYIIDEIAIAETGLPVTGLDYKVAKFGPLATAVYDDIRYENTLFRDYIATNSDNRFCKIIPEKSHIFSDLLFTDYEMELIEKVLGEYGNKAPDDLVKYTHREGAPWDVACKKHNISFNGDSNEPNVTSYFIDFRTLLDSDLKKHNYESFLRSFDF